MGAGFVSIALGMRGPNSCVVSACATGGNNIGDAYHIIRRGDADAMMAGGTEAAITPLAMAGFCAARAMTTRNDDPEAASRPFDKDRDGFVMAEGSGMLLLESLESAQARGAHIYAEIVGYGCAGDAYHITAPAPDGEGATRSMREALRTAGLTPADVDYVNAHGTSTAYNDRNETAAIKAALGDDAYRVAVSSTKSMTGPSERRCRRGRSDLLRPRHARQRAASHHQLLRRPIRTAISTMCRMSPAKPTCGSRCPTPSDSAGTMSPLS